jgi:4-amino-4-deoxy-L-arabinose transferase-like glycosyltransferase
MGTATVLVIYAVVRPLFDRLVGLVASSFLALAFLHVRDSHYATTDVPMTFFVMTAMLAIVRVFRGARRDDAWLAGVLSGFAIATKYTALPLAAPIGIVAAFHARMRRGGWRPRRNLRRSSAFRRSTLATGDL